MILKNAIIIFILLVVKIMELSLHEIFMDFCTSKEMPHGRQGMYQKPPEYQPTEEIIKITECSVKRIEIITQEPEGFQNKKKYVFLKEKDRWLIDKKKWFDPIENKWKAGTL